MSRKKKNKNLPGDSSNCFHSLPNRLAISVFKKKKNEKKWESWLVYVHEKRIDSDGMYADFIVAKWRLAIVVAGTT